MQGDKTFMEPFLLPLNIYDKKSTKLYQRNIAVSCKLDTKKDDLLIVHPEELENILKED